MSVECCRACARHALFGVFRCSRCGRSRHPVVRGTARCIIIYKVECEMVLGARAPVRSRPQNCAVFGARGAAGGAGRLAPRACCVAPPVHARPARNPFASKRRNEAKNYMQGNYAQCSVYTLTRHLTRTGHVLIHCLNTRSATFDPPRRAACSASSWEQEPASQHTRSWASST